MARRRMSAKLPTERSGRAPAADRGPIVIAAGGTAGHVFPAEALAAVLGGRGWRPVVLTDARAASRDFAGAEKHVIAGAGIAGRGARRAVAAGVALACGTLGARRLLARLRPEVVVGFGGYPAVAPMLAARSLRRRPAILLHEQNAVLGRANRALAPLADLLATSYAETRHAPRAAVLTGNPVRAPAAAAASAAYAAPGAEGPYSLLVLGGSLGARIFSDLVPAALAGLPARGALRVVQQCRPEDLPRVEAAYRETGIAAELAAFFPDLPARAAAAHLVIARAGASSVAELAVIGRPALLVPLRGAIDDHQAANAAAYEAAGAAVVLHEPGLTAEALGGAIAALLAAPAQLAAMAGAAARFGRSDAAERLADLVEGMAARRQRR